MSPEFQSQAQIEVGGLAHRSGRDSMSPDPTRYLTPPQVAARLGVKPESVTAWIRSGALRALNLARPGSIRPRYRISPEALDTFERTRTVVPREPIERKPKLDISVKKFV